MCRGIVYIGAIFYNMVV